MNTILQKRIEEAAMQVPFERGTRESFRDGATFALQNQWISVDEGLPDFQQDVVVTNSKGDYWIAWRSNDNCEHKDNNGFVNYGIGEITHWAEIQKFNK